MQLLAVCLLMAAAAVPGDLATPDLVCDCHVRRNGWTFALSCDKLKDEASGVSCRKVNVPEIPQGYVYIPGFALVKLHGIFLTFSAAKKICEDEGSQMVVPRDINAYNGLQKMFETEKAEKRVGWARLGITDAVKKGEYVGVDGLPVTYHKWARGEPNNYGGNQDCIDLGFYGWSNDENCEGPSAFFCERRLSVTVPDSYVWSQLGGRFYKVHTEKQKYAKAAEVCRSENATLAVPDTYRRVQVLQSLLELNDEFYLTDLTDEAVEGDFVTGTGRHLRDMEFQLWSAGEPNNVDHFGKPENCLGLSSKGYLIDVGCEVDKPFICEIPPI